ncbi:MAG: 30S ribosomal protein S6 [bacterium]|nr:30S ribosomal protein S6 [bacterium]
MRTYELVLVFDPALEMEQIDQDLRKLSEMISADGAIRLWERWGKRRLAYEIAGRQYGYYVLSVFDSNPLAVANLDRTIRLNTAVIRHLITVLEPKRVPDTDPESVRTLGAAPEAPAPTIEAIPLMAEERAGSPEDTAAEVPPEVTDEG